MITFTFIMLLLDTLGVGFTALMQLYWLGHEHGMNDLRAALDRHRQLTVDRAQIEQWVLAEKALEILIESMPSEQLAAAIARNNHLAAVVKRAKR